MEFLSYLAGGWAIIWTLLVFVFIVIAVENEQGAIAGVIFVIGAAALVLFGGMPLWGWITSNPWQTLLLAVLYFVAGGVWSLIKWSMYVRSQSDRIAHMHREWKKLRDGPGESFEESSYNPVRASEPANRDRIARWMVWWVPSLFWTLVSDVILGAWNRVYDLLSGAFDRISSSGVRRAIEKDD